MELATMMSPADPPPGFIDLPEQRKGAETIISAFGQGRAGYLINDEMGSGKTVTALRAMLALFGDGRLLILGMKIGVHMWGGALRNFQVAEDTFVVADSGKLLERAMRDGGVRIIVTTHAQTRLQTAALSGWIEGGGLVVDEAHHFRAVGPRESQIARAVFGPSNAKKRPSVTPLARSAAFCVQLTGSPFANGRHREAYNLLRHNLRGTRMWEKNWGNYLYFAQEFCGAWYHDKWGLMDDNNTSRGRFATLLANCSLQRPLTMFKALPQVARKRIEVDMTPAIQRAQRQTAAELGKQYGFYGDGDDFLAFVSRLVDKEERINLPLSKLLKMMATIKAGLARVRAKELLEEDRSTPVVLFGHHREAQMELAEGLRKDNWRVAVINGDVSASARNAIVTDFQDGRYDVLVAGIQATSTSIDLTRARRMVMYELPWRYDDVVQAEARLRRVNSEGRVSSEWILLKGSIDQAIANTLKRKANNARDVAERAERVRQERDRVDVVSVQTRRGQRDYWAKRLGTAIADDWRKEVVSMMVRDGMTIEQVASIAPSPDHEQMAREVMAELQQEAM